MEQPNHTPDGGAQATGILVKPELAKCDFPESWRYLPLRWSDDGWVPAIAYVNDPRYHGFRGFDTAGNWHLYIDDDEPDLIVTGDPVMSMGPLAYSQLPGKAVGILPEWCDPPLAILDCDSDVHYVEPPEDTKSVNFSDLHTTTYGIEQLRELEDRYRRLPPSPVAKGTRKRHGYLIFRQGDKVISGRKIRPRGLSLDIIARGYQVHWSAPGKRLLSGAELLEEPPALPVWIASYLTSGRRRGSGVVVSGDYKGLATEPVNPVLLDCVLNSIHDGQHEKYLPKGRGTWNQSLFDAACLLAEMGLPYGDTRKLVLDRCRPWNRSEQHKAVESIKSAWRKVTGQNAGKDR